MNPSHFARVVRRLAEDVSEEQDSPEIMGQLVLAMRAAGLNPDDDADRERFVKMLRKLTPQKLATAAKRMTTSKATAAGKAAKAASRE